MVRVSRMVRKAFHDATGRAGQPKGANAPPGVIGRLWAPSGISGQPRRDRLAHSERLPDLTPRGSTAQKHPWGSHAWRRSYDLRNVVEGSAGILRNAGGSDMKRDHIRVMGLAANSLLLTIAVAGMNLRLLATHLQREDEPQTSAPAPNRPGGYDAIIEHDLACDADGSFRRKPGADPPAA